MSMLFQTTLPDHYEYPPSLLETTCLYSMVLFKIYWRQHTISKGFALRTMKHLKVIKYVLSCFSSSPVCFALNIFSFQQIKKALSYSINMTIPTAAHAALKIILF